MARQYSPEEKAAALDLLHEKGGDVPLVSYLTGISERTLYTWKKHLQFAQAAEEKPQPLHWIRQQPEREQRMQQQQEKRLLQQQRQHNPNQMTAFGITQEQLDEMMKVEFAPGPYANLHADLMLHLQHINYSLTDEPESAHRKALAFSRILEAALSIEERALIHKPQLTIFKYEYPDGTYHDVPYWSNALHERATQAYEAVIEEGRRQYEAQQAALNPNPIEQEPYTSTSLTNDMEELLNPPTLEELLAMPFQPEDFIPKHTGIHKYLLGEDPYADYNEEPSPDSSEGDEPKPPIS